MYGGFWLWDAHFVVFYEVMRLCGGTVTNEPMALGGSAKENPSRAWGAGRGRGAGELDLMNVSRILALGGSIYRILRVWKARGGSIYYILRGSEALGGLRV